MAPTPPGAQVEQFLTASRGLLLKPMTKIGTTMMKKRVQALPNLEVTNAIRSTSSTAMDISHILTAREKAETQFHPGEGAIDPHSINMKGIMALFALIGAAFVIAAIWFFFWAKNGGFVWRKGDWEDYKSTVLRRKDANGRTLSCATKSTKLGGGSVVGRGYSDYDENTTTMDTATVITEAVTNEEKPSRGKRLRETAKQKLLRRRKDETWEGGHDEDMRAYRNEKPATVGGINREPDGTYNGTEYTGTVEQRSEWTQSEMGETHAETETRYDAPDPERRVQGSRNVSGFSFTAGAEDTISNVTEEHQARESVRRGESRHGRSGNSQRPRGPRPSSSRQTSSRRRDRSAVPGGYTSPLDMSSITASDYTYDRLGDNGTKTYHHPIPALSKGYRRAGGGRGRRRDSLSDSDGDDFDSRLS